jgi:hypothetical protein
MGSWDGNFDKATLDEGWCLQVDFVARLSFHWRLGAF